MSKNKIRLVPAILAKNKKEFVQQWRQVAPYFSYIQIDIMDGRLVKTKNNIQPATIKNLTRQHKLEIHLMVKNVPAYLKPWLKLKNVKKIIWHYEAEKNLRAHLCLNQYLGEQKIQTGLALNPGTSLAKIKKIIPYFSTLQLLGVTPGKQGQKFQLKILTKLKGLRAKYPHLNIAVDGGINERNFSLVKRAGANSIVLGNFLQTSTNLKKDLRQLR